MHQEKKDDEAKYMRGKTGMTKSSGEKKKSSVYFGLLT